MKGRGKGAVLVIGLMELALGCPSAPARQVEIAPAPTAAPPPAVVQAPPPPPDGAAPIRSEAHGSWARAFPAAKTFRAIAAPATRSLVLVWRIGPQRKLKQLDPSEDYPSNYVQPVDLVVGDGADRREVSLGELAGGVERFGASYCRGRGFRPPRETPWSFPSEPSVAAAFALGVVQGDSEFLLVRDDEVLHVLHRETSDGRCDEIKQGPLDGCEGFEYERIAEIRLAPAAALYELVLDDGKPLDCTVPTLAGSALLPP